MAKPTAKVSAAVLALTLGIVLSFEGNPPKAYMDRLPLNPTPTACMGHTGADVRVGVAYSAAQCEQWAREDIAIANATVHRCITAPMTANQEAALTDFAYNVGPGVKGVKDGLCTLRDGSAPKIRQYANAGQWSAACQQITRWVYAGGKELPGLVRRRHAERELCEKRQ
ncbi:lysozyme [Dyella caseinilytica]|uniref:Lysozyme n=1 Tax=Dyella caseinilytica TaxID=1849581 RepID=A0ABX7GR53_9GAMM|nr:lysozyme [Dyella caseinilytica]QRN52404.1 lysozyme [Dyella caseinilytica]GGA05699.1 lysozyme [Dyella caseinilytica]